MREVACVALWYSMNAFFLPFSWMTLHAFLAATHRQQVLLHRLRRAAHPSEVVPKW